MIHLVQSDNYLTGTRFLGNTLLKMFFSVSVQADSAQTDHNKSQLNGIRTRRRPPGYYSQELVKKSGATSVIHCRLF